MDGLQWFFTRIKIPFPFLSVGPYPIACLFQSWRVTTFFTGLVLWQTVPLTRGFSGKSIISPAYCLSSPFMSCLFSIHIQKTHPLARQFECFVIGADGANVRKCTLSIIYATHYLPPGYLPCIMYLVLPYSDLGPAINSKENLSLRAAGVLLNGWGRRRD